MKSPISATRRRNPQFSAARIRFRAAALAANVPASRVRPNAQRSGRCKSPERLRRPKPAVETRRGVGCFASNRSASGPGRVRRNLGAAFRNRGKHENASRLLRSPPRRAEFSPVRRRKIAKRGTFRTSSRRETLPDVVKVGTLATPEVGGRNAARSRRFPSLSVAFAPTFRVEFSPIPLSQIAERSGGRQGGTLATSGRLAALESDQSSLRLRRRQLKRRGGLHMRYVR